MPTFENFQESQVTKAIILGHTGAGKTGALASLAAAGYNVRILDLDKGVEILKDYVLNPQSIYTKANPGHWTQDDCRDIAKRITYVTITEKMSIKAGRAIPRADGWKRVNDQLDHWRDGETDLGNIGTWGPKDVLVIDTLSRASSMAFNFILAMNGRLLVRPEQSDWGQGQKLVEDLLTMLYSDEVKCNVIVNAHISYIETEAGPTRGFAQTLGKALSPKVGQYFNHALMAKTTGQGEAQKRVIVTNTSGIIELKNPAPLRVKPEYPLETGLADYFRDVRVASPVPAKAAQAPVPAIVIGDKP